MEDGRRHAGGGAADTPVAGHVTVRTAQCATIAALLQPICSPAAARGGSPVGRSVAGTWRITVDS